MVVIFSVEKLVSIWQSIKRLLPTTVFVIIITLLICLFLGLFSSDRYKDTREELDRPSDPAVAHVEGISKTNTTVAYVPKRIVNGIKEDTDVEVKIEKPKVVAVVNGKRQELALKETEKQKFEDGKVVVDQKSEITLDVKVPDHHELNIYTDTTYRGDTFHYGIGIEKQNGKLKYGVHYDIKDKDTMVYVRYDIIRAFSH